MRDATDTQISEYAKTRDCHCVEGFRLSVEEFVVRQSSEIYLAARWKLSRQGDRSNASKPVRSIHAFVQNPTESHLMLP